MQLWAFEHTGWVGKTVLAILLLFSVIFCATMFIIGRRFRRSAAASKRFTAAFRKPKRLIDVQGVTSIDQRPHRGGAASGAAQTTAGRLS